MDSKSLPESTPVILSQTEWSALNDAISNFHTALHCCRDVDAERKLDLLHPVYKQLSSAAAPINERMGEQEGGGHDVTH